MLTLLPNPAEWPQTGSLGVTTGYQRQNTNMAAVQTGLDTTAPYESGNNIVIPQGGVVEVNGTMYAVTAQETLTKTNINTANWIEVVPRADGTAYLRPTTHPGKWNPAKNGCYTAANRRTLNWVSSGAPWMSSLTEVFSKNTKGEWYITLPKGWYAADMSSGLGGGNGVHGGEGGAGGVFTGGAGGEGGAGGVVFLPERRTEAFFHNGIGLIRVKVGGNGWNGGKGGEGGEGGAGFDRPTTRGGPGGGGGGGGGGGEGEETFAGNISTGEARPGFGGFGGIDGLRKNGGDGGGVGGRGSGFNGLPGSSTDSADNGGEGGRGGESGYYGADGEPGLDGGRANEIGGGGGGGGGGGIGGHGKYRPVGSTNAGFCNIYALGG